MSLKQAHSAVVGLLLLAMVGENSHAQQSAPAAPQTASASQQLSVGKAVKKTVGLVAVRYVAEDGVLMRAEGTCFFVYYPDARVGKNQGFVYLVTNRHVASPGIEDGHPFPTRGMTLRLNRKDATGSDEGPVLLGNSLHWYFPADDAIDLAVLPVAPDPAKYEIEPYPLSMLLTQAEVEADNIGEGDSVLFTGVFYQFPGLKKFEPIVREGVVAMMPDEQLDTTLKKRGNIYLADVHVFGGNSGSPLLINLGGLRNGALRMSVEYKMLGVISGFYTEDADLTLSIATTYRGTVKGNSGIAMVVPAYALRELLDSPSLQATRDAFVASRRVP